MIESSGANCVLGRVLAWGQGVPEFNKQRAHDGVETAEGWLSGMVDRCDDDVVLLALNNAFIFWIDDRSDVHLASRPEIEWGALLDFVQKGEGKTTPETTAFGDLSRRMSGAARKREEHVYWKSAAERMLRAMWSEELAEREGRSSSYTECLERGALSIGAEMSLAAAYLVRGLDRPSRSMDTTLLDLEKHFCRYERLLNDLGSYKQELSQGRTVSTVLTMTRTVPLDAARTFVEEQRRTYRRLVDECLMRLGAEDPCAEVIRRFCSHLDRWYGSRPKRYELR